MSIFTFFKVRRFRKAIKRVASVILSDLATIATETVLKYQDEGGKENLLFKETLKLESMAYLLWILRRSSIFQNDSAHRLFLDYIHDEYYAVYKRNGYNFEQRKVISDLLNDRYREYDSAVNNRNISAIGAIFCRHLSETSGADIDTTNFLIPIELQEMVGVLLEEYKNKFTELGLYNEKN